MTDSPRANQVKDERDECVKRRGELVAQARPSTRAFRHSASPILVYTENPYKGSE